MSYDIDLKDPVTGDIIQFDAPHYMTGGTYVLGGTSEASLNITYNYSRWYYKDGVFPRVDDPLYPEGRGGIRSIYGMSGAESIPVLKKAIATLEAMDEDLTEMETEEHLAHGATGYWLPTRGNAIKPLYQLLSMAQMRPDGVWGGD